MGTKRIFKPQPVKQQDKQPEEDLRTPGGKKLPYRW